MMEALLAVVLTTTLAQNFEQRGFIENLTYAYPQTAPNDSGHLVDLMLVREEASYQAVPWLRIAAAFDAETDTHRQVAREWYLDWDGRSIQRPPFSARRFSATIHKGKVTAEVGRQFIRWGKTDILNPTDVFAPKDYLANVIAPDFLGVIAARVTIEATSRDSIDLVWQPWFTPSRTPLLNQRWTVIPEQAAGLGIIDAGARYPGGSQFGARWNHVGSGYEFSLCAFDGDNNLPLFSSTFEAARASVALERYYPRLRLMGADAAVPLPWFTVKGEAAYFSSPTANTDQYALYVIQLERQVREWAFVGGYAGEAKTQSGNPLQFQPQEGFAKSFVGNASWTIDPRRSLGVSAAVRGGGSFTRVEYSQTYGQHWRATAGFARIRGDMNNFIGQYHRNSYASLAVRYSF
jgi:hypothetical protein